MLPPFDDYVTMTTMYLSEDAKNINGGAIEIPHFT